MKDGLYFFAEPDRRGIWTATEYEGGIPMRMRMYTSPESHAAIREALRAEKPPAPRITSCSCCGGDRSAPDDWDGTDLGPCGVCIAMGRA